MEKAVISLNSINSFPVKLMVNLFCELNIKKQDWVAFMSQPY